MKIAIIASNENKVSINTKQGTAIFTYNLIRQIKQIPDIHVTLFAPLSSEVPTKTCGVITKPASEDKNIGIRGPRIYFDTALIAKAIEASDQYDIFHFNIANGELILPFARFTDKPILITPHGSLDNKHAHKYFSLFKNLKNVYFVSVSNVQRSPLVFLNYIRTIYHGVDTSLFAYKDNTDDYIIWVGRGVPEKGLDEVITVINHVQRKAKIYPILKTKHIEWLKTEVLKERNLISKNIEINTNFDVNRYDLPLSYQSSKLFLNPIKWEEPFGLVMIEAMACGTPVVAYARGSVPEIIKDGVTGFIVNSTEKDKRGDWIVKKTGVPGLIEAVERIYAMPKSQYHQMRLNCRKHVEKHFTIERMVNEYVQTYQEILADYQKKKTN